MNVVSPKRLNLNAQLLSIRNLILDIEAEVRSLEEKVLTDDLTGLLRRNAFMNKFGTMLNRAEKDGKNVGVMMIDIDHFKKINDTLGHSGGDDILRQVSGYLKNLENKNVIVGRFGGEEFILAIMGKENDIENFAEQMRSGISNLKCTVSIGVAHTSLCGLIEKDLIEDADAALYEAKRAGRNQVKCAA